MPDRGRGRGRFLSWRSGLLLISVPYLLTLLYLVLLPSGLAPKLALFQVALYSSTGVCYLPSQFRAGAAAEEVVGDEDVPIHLDFTLMVR